LPRNGFEDLTPAPGNDTPRHAARRAKKFKLKKSETQPLTLPAPAPPPPQVAEATTSVGKEGDTESHAPRAGSIYGSLAEGPLFGPQVRPALPISGPNPIITRSELPAGVEGSVIVQITIDERGNITSTKLVQKLGYGIDERVLSAVQQWRFKPATRDGVAIASQQTCVFHFPSGAG
jgi:protein TonB